jgi:uncharacterized protein involved in oxidation of intracellular sulfur
MGTIWNSEEAELGKPLELDLEVQCCGRSLKAQAMEILSADVGKNSMKELSGWNQRCR